MFGFKNPFQMAASALAIGKRIFIFLGTVITGMGGWVTINAALAEAQTKQSFDATKGATNECEELSKNEQFIRNLLKAWDDSSKK